MYERGESHLPRSQDDGGDLRPVSPLGQEGECEGLEEDDRRDGPQAPEPTPQRGRGLQTLL